ncbi:MAG: 50S ribosomal protein L10 [Planctomycetota bacterium]
MPSRLKKLMVKEAAERYAEADSLVAVSYERIDAEEASALRRSFRERNVELRVVRNRVTRLAFDEIGRSAFAAFLDGEVAVIAAEDPVEASKAAVELARERKLEVKGGWAEGAAITQEEVRRLSALPSRKALLAQIAGLAAAPLVRLVGMMGAPAAALARALGAWNEKRGEGGDQDAA